MLVLRIAITVCLVVLALMFSWAAASDKDTKASVRIGAVLIAVVHVLSILAIWG